MPTYTLESAYYGQLCFTPLAAQPQYLQIAYTSLHKKGGLSYHVTLTSRQGNQHSYIFRHNESSHQTIPFEQARKIWCHLVGEGWEAVP